MSAYRIDLLPENDRSNDWAAYLPPRVARPHLTGDVRADRIVVSAGWAGLAAARRLAKNRPSDRGAIIDAAAADGASGRNDASRIPRAHAPAGLALAATAAIASSFSLTSGSSSPGATCSPSR